MSSFFLLRKSIFKKLFYEYLLGINSLSLSMTEKDFYKDRFQKTKLYHVIEKIQHNKDVILLKLVYICKYVAIPKLPIFHVTMLYRHVPIELEKKLIYILFHFF